MFIDDAHIAGWLLHGFFLTLEEKNSEKREFSDANLGKFLLVSFPIFECSRFLGWVSVKRIK